MSESEKSDMSLAPGGGCGGKRIWVYTFAWNEEKILPYFLRHYLEWLGAERVTVFDNQSTDGTAKICDSNPKVIRSIYKTDNTHSELNAMVSIRNTCWTRAKGKADFVMIVDCDEFVYHNDMPRFLQDIADSNTSMVRAHGYDMASTVFPPAGVHLPNHVRTGIYTPTYSKPCLFCPDRVHTIQFTPGAHHVTSGDAPGFSPKQYAGLRLLHYPRLGWDFYLERMLSRRARANPRDAMFGLSNHYTRDINQMRVEFDHVLTDAADCVT